jgi:2-(1,2-epoxy-1,2-dihydrophenyl)acetyl-CoA isomerase
MSEPGAQSEPGDLVLLERDGDVAVLRFNDPGKLNPISIPLQQRFRDALVEVREDRGLRALVVSGIGKAFCVGADLKSMNASDAIPGHLGDHTAEMMTSLSNPLILALRELPLPVISAVNGPAAGAGVGIALAADVVLAARSAYFYLPFLPRLGIVPDLGTTWFLERLVGRSRALAMSLLGERLSAEQAAQWGLAWACVDDAALMPEALALARRMARLPAHAVLEARRAFDAAEHNGLAQQLAYEAGRQRELVAGPAFAEGVRAFIEKRDPLFPGR